MAQDLVTAAIAVGKAMLVGGMDDVLELVGGKIDGVSLVPLEELPRGLFLGEPEEPKFGSKPDGAIVSMPGFHMALPDFLRPQAVETEVGHVLGTAEAVFEWLPCDSSHLAPNPLE